MKRRRDFLTALGAGGVALAGCGGSTDDSGRSPSSTDSTSTPQPTPGGTDTASEAGTPTAAERTNQQIREGIPLEGLGAYEDAVLEADQPDTATANQIDSILEGDNTAEDLRNGLDDIATTDNLHQVMRYFHQQQQNTDQTVVINRNWSFTSDSEPILELYTVQNGQLQSQPTIVDTSAPTPQINQPGQNNPQYLADLRISDGWTILVPEDHEGLEQRIEDAKTYENASEEDIRELRENIYGKWSNAIPGLDDSDMVKPEDPESTISVFEAKYGDGDTRVLTDLENQYFESSQYDTDTMTTAHYNGEDWVFTERPDIEMGDSLAN